MQNISFLGAQPYARLRSLYRHAIALVVPSVCYEVFPMVMLEAFAEATPVIARDLAGIAEIVNDSRGGILFRDEAGLQQALDGLQTNSWLRRSLGENGHRALKERWTADAHIRQYFKVIDACREARGIKTAQQASEHGGST
jgi:glycosyltransferase involved in cell wall biosynthesis